MAERAERGWLVGGYAQVHERVGLARSCRAIRAREETVENEARWQGGVMITLKRAYHAPARDGSMREGATLGLIVATSTWIWVAVVDAVVGEPFRTFTVLGGIAAFTIVHYLLNVIYGVLLVSGIRGTTREPTLMMAIIFGFLMV